MYDGEQTNHHRWTRQHVPQQPLPSRCAIFTRQETGKALQCVHPELHQPLGIRDGNIALHGDINGPTVRHPSVTALEIGFPALSMQGSPTVKEGFPKLEHLILAEQNVNLFGSERMINGCDCMDTAEYLEKVLGGGTLPTVKMLTLRLVLPDHKRDGILRPLKQKSIVKDLLKKLPNLAYVELQYTPPWTCDYRKALLMASLYSSGRCATWRTILMEIVIRARS